MSSRTSIRFVATQIAVLLASVSPFAALARPGAPQESSGAPAAAAAPAEPYRAVALRADAATDALVIDDPLCNGRPFFPIVVTPRTSVESGATGLYLDAQVGARYDTGSGKWAIVMQDHSAIPAGAEFNVTISDGIVARATGSFPFVLDDPSLNGNPNARLQISHLISSPVGPEVYVDHPVAASYTGGHWTIYHADFTPIAANELYAVVNDGVLCVVVPDDQSNDDFVTIDDPLTNGKPDVVLTVTGNASSTCAEVESDPNSICVRYDGSKWQIVNENHTPMTFGGFAVSVHQGPEIVSAAFNARGKLVVRAVRFDAGAVLVVADEDQVTTIRKPEAGGVPGKLLVKTLSGSVPQGAVSVRIRNTDGALSRPIEVAR